MLNDIMLVPIENIKHNESIEIVVISPLSYGQPE